MLENIVKIFIAERRNDVAIYESDKTENLLGFYDGIDKLASGLKISAVSICS